MTASPLEPRVLRNMRGPPRRARAGSPVVEVLGNGATVVVDGTRFGSQADAPVAVELWVAAGAADEPEGREGIAHLLEHMVFKPRTPGRPDLAARIEALGADVNAFTGYDETVYHLVAPRSAFVEAARSMLEAVLAPALRPEDVATERGVVLEELRLSHDDPEQRMQERAWRTLVGAGHPYGHPILGTERTVRGLGAEALRRFHRSVYTGRRLHLVVAGPVAADPVVEALAPLLARRPAGRRPPGPRPFPGRPRRRIVVERGEVAEGHLVFLWRCGSADLPAQVGWEVLAQILGCGENAWLSQRLIRDEGLLSSVHAAFYPGRHGGVFAVHATARPGDVADALEAVPRTLAELGRRGIPTAALTRARSALRGDLLIGRETAAGRAQELGTHVILHGTVHPYEERSEALGRLGPETVASMLERLVGEGAGPVAGVCVPPDVDLGPSPTRRLRRGLRPVGRERGGGGRAGDLEVRRLPNGIRLCLAPDPSLPLVAGTVAFSAGQLAEPAELAGISVLAARCAGLASGQRGPEALAEALALRCASIEPFSGRTLTGLSFECAAPELGDVLEFVRDCIEDPAFDTDLVVDERRILIEEIRGRADDLQWLAARKALERRYAGHPFARDRLGRVSTVRRLSADAVADHWHDRIAAAAPVVALAGAFDPDAAADHVAAWAGGPVRRRRGPRARAPAPRKGGTVVRLARPRAQTYLALAFPAPDLASDRVPAVELAAAVLGGQGGLLFEALREREGLVYSVSVSTIHTEVGGHALVLAATTPSKAERTLARIFEGIEALRRGRVARERVEGARTYLRGQHGAAYERRSAVAAAMAFDEIRGLGADHHRTIPARLAALAFDDVVEAARRTFRREVGVVARVGAVGGTRLR